MENGPRSRAALLPLVLITALFFLWGVANNLNDVLIPQFKKTFTLNDWQSGLVQSAFYMGYFVLALPAGMVMRRFGYKSAVVVGLILYGTGALLFYPAAEARQYSYFLVALFVIASGLAFLETSANPLMTVLGDPAKSEQRLNFAQAFNPAGSIAGIFIGREFILSGHEPTAAQLAALSPAALEQFRAAEAQAVQGPYLLLAGVVLILAAIVSLVRFPAQANRPPADADEGSVLGDLPTLLARPRFVFGVVAQFFYVGAQVGVWSFMIRYAQAEEPGMGEKAAAGVLIASLWALFAGRFVGTALMSLVAPWRLMAGYAAVNVALVAIAVVVGGMTGLYALAATSFFMSIMFPTIFATAVKDLGPLTKTGSSFVVMAIIGGAVLTPLMGWISHVSSMRIAMGVPAVCFVVVGLYALSAGKAAAAR
ncbi:L-fucose:H+ symporter permease [Caulobacter sp. DWR1-3-2b1]|uniref:L-fucose:H+ symporter permease n=1 Tax=Caulobacter sp. DWR1-3-2b1 TaxID=2804670 RepID=UPI003CEC740A